jgi:hypothetical protein
MELGIARYQGITGGKVVLHPVHDVHGVGLFYCPKLGKHASKKYLEVT